MLSFWDFSSPCISNKKIILSQNWLEISARTFCLFHTSPNSLTWSPAFFFFFLLCKIHCMYRLNEQRIQIYSTKNQCFFFWKSVLSFNLFYLTCLIGLSSQFSPIADSFQQSLQVIFRYNCKQFQFKNISERERSLLASNQDKSPGLGILQTMLKEDIQGLKYYPLVYLVISIFSTANRWVD